MLIDVWKQFVENFPLCPEFVFLLFSLSGLALISLTHLSVGTSHTGDYHPPPPNRGFWRRYRKSLKLKQFGTCLRNWCCVCETQVHPGNCAGQRRNNLLNIYEKLPDLSSVDIGLWEAAQMIFVSTLTGWNCKCFILAVFVNPPHLSCSACWWKVVAILSAYKIKCVHACTCERGCWVNCSYS